MNLLLLWLALAGGPRIDASPTFDFRAQADLGDPHKAISTRLANRTLVPRGDQHFCVVGYRTPEWTWA